MAAGPVIQCNREGIQELCRQVADGLDAVPDCPCCSAKLQVTLAKEGAVVSCPSGCFRFECRRESHSGAVVTGVLEFPGQACGLRGALPRDSSIEAAGPTP